MPNVGELAPKRKIFDQLNQGLFQRIRDSIRKLLSPKQYRTQELENEILLKENPLKKSAPTKDTNWMDVAYVLRKRKYGSVCDVFGLENTPENRYAILLALLQKYLPEVLSNEQCEVKPEHRYIYFEIDREGLKHMLLDLFEAPAQTPTKEPVEKPQTEKNPYTDYTSLYRHLYRSGGIAMMLMAHIEERAAHGDDTANAVISNFHPEFAFMIGFLHDIARYVSHGSDHDAWEEKLMKDLGIRQEIVDAKHEPVKLDDTLPPDSTWQMISRLADVFGKLLVSDQLLKLRTSIEDVSQYSYMVQLTRYLEKEVHNQSSMWHGRTEDDVRRYIELEKERLQVAEKWLESIGLSFEHILHTINIVMHNPHTINSGSPLYDAMTAVGAVGEDLNVPLNPKT